MMKKLLKSLLVVTLLFNFFVLNINNVNASSTYTATVIDTEGMNVRTGPGTNYSKVSVLSYRSTVTLVNNTKISGQGCDAGWYQINYGGSTDRYACSSGLSISESNNNTNGYYTTNDWGTRISEDYAYVKTTPGGSTKDTIFLGTKVNVLSESGSWVQISYYNGQTGWVAKKLVKSYQDVTATDETYNEVLKAAGFPESYWPFLTKLHQQHPTWTFTADFTNKDFSSSISAETGKNYIQSTNDALRLNSISMDSGGWYTAVPSVVAVYMDPRNYLNETNIFAFETLSYDAATQTKAVLNSIFSGSYLNTDEYIGYFMNAGQSYGISPVHLAARVKQEGGTNAGYNPVNGASGLSYNGTSLNGYYNYYNIGAFASNGVDAVTRGLAVAAGLISYSVEGTPWNTREKAIMYGAKWIARDYINAGQDSLYYQKFNVSNDSKYSAYTHQYMTNVVATASESLSTYNSYTKAGLMDTAFTFAIPVYDNTPSEFTTLPPIGDTNNNLSDLKINEETVTGFDSDVVEYTSYVSHDTEAVNITASLASSAASVVGTGVITLTGNETIAKVLVTSQTGEVKTYTITIIKQAKPIIPDNSEEITYLTPEQITNAMDIKFSNNYMTNISQGTTATTLINMAKEKEATAEVTIKDKEGNIKENANLATGDKITIISNNTEAEYTIVIKGDNNGDGLINTKDLLRVQKHILGYVTLTEAELDAADNNYDNEINTKDLLRTQKHILGYVTIK